MSSSGSVSTSSSSESTESDRSKDRQLGREGTSSGVVTSGMPMEVVREVREDPPRRVGGEQLAGERRLWVGCC